MRPTISIKSLEGNNFKSQMKQSQIKTRKEEMITADRKKKEIRTVRPPQTNTFQA